MFLDLNMVLCKYIEIWLFDITVYPLDDASDQTDFTQTVNSNVEKIPLAAHLTVMLAKIGFTYLNEVIWDKGGYENIYEHTALCYPFKTMPKNCCEHILIFAKRKANYQRIPCPYCGEMITGRAGMTPENAKKWRCDNPDCSSRIGHKGGSYFSEYSIMVNSRKTAENAIPFDVADKWHRNIVKIEPVVDHYSKKYYMTIPLTHHCKIPLSMRKN